MKNRVNAILIGLALALVTSSSSYAMSELIALSVEPEWPGTSTPGTVIVYKVTAIGRSGQGLLEVALTSAGLPDGMTVSFSPSVLRFTGHALTNQTSTMTITCPAVMPTDIYPFTVTATARREAITVTNQIVLAVNGLIAAPLALSVDPLPDGGFRLRGQGSTGLTYQIESTPDLNNPVWKPLGTTTADGNGRFTLPTDLPKDLPMEFYRAVWMPSDPGTGDN